MKKALRKGFSECIHSASETSRNSVGRWKPKNNLSPREPIYSYLRQVEVALGALHKVRLVVGRPELSRGKIVKKIRLRIRDITHRAALTET